VRSTLKKHNLIVLQSCTLKNLKWGSAVKVGNKVGVKFRVRISVMDKVTFTVMLRLTVSIRILIRLC